MKRNRGGLPVGSPLLAVEEKSFVLADGPAKSEAEIVLLQFLPLCEEGIAAVEGVVTNEFVSGAVPVIGADFNSHGDRGSARHAVFGVVVIAQDAEFAERFERRKSHQRRLALSCIDVEGAV